MKEYIKKDITKEWLLKNEFRYNRHFGIKDDSIFTCRFPVAKQKGKYPISLECELLAYYPEGIIRINVYNYGTRDKYASFYNAKYGNWDKMLKSIHNKIDKKLKSLGVTESKNE